MSEDVTYTQFKRKRVRLLHAEDVTKVQKKSKGNVANNYSMCSLCGRILVDVDNDTNKFFYNRRVFYIITNSFLRYNICRDAKTCYEHRNNKKG